MKKTDSKPNPLQMLVAVRALHEELMRFVRLAQKKASPALDDAFDQVEGALALWWSRKLLNYLDCAGDHLVAGNHDGAKQLAHDGYRQFAKERHPQHLPYLMPRLPSTADDSQDERAHEAIESPLLKAQAIARLNWQRAQCRVVALEYLSCHILVNKPVNECGVRRALQLLQDFVWSEQRHAASTYLKLSVLLGGAELEAARQAVAVADFDANKEVMGLLRLDNSLPHSWPVAEEDALRKSIAQAALKPVAA